MIPFSLTSAQETVASPFCVFETPCPRQGRAVLGQPYELHGAENTPVRCLWVSQDGSK